MPWCLIMLNTGIMIDTAFGGMVGGLLEIGLGEPGLKGIFMLMANSIRLRFHPNLFISQLKH